MGASEGQELESDQALGKADDLLSKLASMVQAGCPNLLGKEIDERSPSLISLSLREEDEAEYVPPMADVTLGAFLGMWRRTCVKAVSFFGPGKASVTLESTGAGAAEALPAKQESVQLEAAAGVTIVYLPGAFSYALSVEEGEVLSMSSAFLEHTNALKLGDFVGDARLLRGPCDGPPELQREGVHVINLASRLMACWDEPEAYRAGLYGGGDAGVSIPFTRWSVSDYFCPDSTQLQPWQTATRHQAVVEGLELFDNKYFEVTLPDARVMDPMQRHVLEVGAKNLFKMGITKRTSNRQPRHGGCSVGLDKADWDKMDDKPQGGSNVQAIISNRFSFIFNLRGPNFVADTACSASLCATHLATFTLADRTNDKIEFHIALGIHQCLTPLPFIGASQGHMLSPIGRCLTFNASASGYMRGDGCSGMTLKWGSGTELQDTTEAVWRGSGTGQNGRSATMTAPNGLAQEDVILKAMRAACVTAPESSIWSCHGTGTSLGDPIEVGAVRKVQMRQERASPLLISSNKPNTGHLEGGAAMTSLLAAVLQLKASTSIPVNHFRQLNPHLEQSQFNSVMPNEAMTYKTRNGIVHVSSFGFGGTNGHVCFWGENLYGLHADAQSVLVKQLHRNAPEVRVNGSDPSQWEWDGPDTNIKPGDSYTVHFPAGMDGHVRWEKETAEAPDNGEDDFFCLVGSCNEWIPERMEETSVVGLRTITVQVPRTGEVTFRFLKNGDEGEILFPPVDRCNNKALAALGPAGQDGGRELFSWLATGPPGGALRIDLFVCRGRTGVMWVPIEAPLVDLDLRGDAE